MMVVVTVLIFFSSKVPRAKSYAYGKPKKKCLDWKSNPGPFDKLLVGCVKVRYLRHRVVCIY